MTSEQMVYLMLMLFGLTVMVRSIRKWREEKRNADDSKDIGQR